MSLTPPLQTFLSTPLSPLSVTSSAPLFSGVDRAGGRDTNSSRPPVHALQSYIVRNNSTVYDRGENTIYAPPSPQFSVPTTGKDYFNYCTQLYRAKITRDGSILGYMIYEASTDRPLVKVHFHGDTSNPLSRAFKAFVRSPILKWDVENFGLYTDLEYGANLGRITEVFPDNRIFEPSETLQGMPRLEMQVAAALGRKYFLAVTGVPEPIGQVDSDIVGRFAPRSETYSMTLRNCTREEAVFMLCMVIATDMKRRKSQNTKYGRSFIPVYL